MSLACEQQDDGTLGVAQDSHQARPVPQQQCRPFIGSKPPRKADRQDIGPGGIEEARHVS